MKPLMHIKVPKKKDDDDIKDPILDPLLDSVKIIKGQLSDRYDIIISPDTVDIKTEGLVVINITPDIDFNKLFQALNEYALMKMTSLINRRNE